MKSKTALALICMHLFLLPLSKSQVPSGDRNIGRTEEYPTSLLIQNGGRIYNVKNPPNGRPAASGNGITDDTEALRSAINYIAEQARLDGVGVTIGEWQKIYPIYLPAGTYLVSNSLHYTGELIPDFFFQTDPTRGGFQCLQIMGQSRESTIIKLANNLPLFAANGGVKRLVHSFYV
jgi:Pectate lyase superfamily protein